MGEIEGGGGTRTDKWRQLSTPVTGPNPKGGDRWGKD
jgi:hypothetical protein